MTNNASFRIAILLLLAAAACFIAGVAQKFTMVVNNIFWPF